MNELYAILLTAIPLNLIPKIVEYYNWHIKIPSKISTIIAWLLAVPSMSLIMFGFLYINIYLITIGIVLYTIIYIFIN